MDYIYSFTHIFLSSDAYLGTGLEAAVMYTFHSQVNSSWLETAKVDFLTTQV